jgi:hypothetical protein
MVDSKEKAEMLGLEEKSILKEYVLDKTDLDEKALKAIDEVELFLREKKNNLIFVWKNFPKVSYIFLFAGAVCGYIISLILQSLT